MSQQYYSKVYRKMKTYPYKELYMNVHTSIIHNSKKQKQPQCPSTGEQMNEMLYIQAMEYYLEEKKNGVLMYDTRLMYSKIY